MDFKKILQFAGPLGVIVAVAATIGYALGYVSLSVFETVLGIGGFAGIAGLRSAIASSGYKTFILAAGGALVGLGNALGLVSAEVTPVLLSILGLLAIPTLKMGVDKVK